VIGLPRRHKKEDYQITVIEVEVSEEEMLERLGRYKEALYKLLFTNEYRKSKQNEPHGK
jgi:hypothetical protein